MRLSQDQAFPHILCLPFIYRQSVVSKASPELQNLGSRINDWKGCEHVVKKTAVQPGELVTKSKSVIFSSVSQSYPTLCDPMNRSTPGLPVNHQHPENTQTHVHSVSNAIQPSHTLLSPSHPALNLSQHQGLFKGVSSSHQRARYWDFSFNISPSNEHPGLISFRMDLLDLLAVHGTLQSSLTPRFKSINSSVLSFLYSPTLTSIHDHWKSHSLD